MKLLDQIVIGVIGQFNKGKTFILSQLSDYKLDHGFSISTKGLSVKFPENLGKQVTILDTAGFETPLYKYLTN